MTHFTKGFQKSAPTKSWRLQMRRVECQLRTGDLEQAGSWLPDMDLNHDKQIQSLLCYRYTIGQMSASKVKVGQGESRLLKGSTARPGRGRRRNPVGVEFSSES